MSQSTNTVWCVLGPTAVGKTQVAMSLARHLPCNIISVDSAMVYRGLDIGTAKPSEECLQKYPHQLINICEPNQVYSTGQFVSDATQMIERSFAAGRIPLLVGGTMLYFHALQHGLSDLPSADQSLRQQISEEIATLGLARVHQKLQAVDPVAAAKIHPNDPQRLQRALEVYYLTGQPLSQFWQQQASTTRRYDFHNLILMPSNRADLHQRIAQRLATMFSIGLVDEVKGLIQSWNLPSDSPALRTVGYREVCRYLAGELSLEEAKQQALFATRQLAKRQITWLRRWPSGVCFSGEPQRLTEALMAYLDSSYFKM